MAGSNKAAGAGVTLLLGVALGWTAARLSTEARQAEREVDPAGLAVETSPADPTPALQATEPAPSADRPVRDARIEAEAQAPVATDGWPVAKDDLIGSALERHARAGIARGWGIERDDEIPPGQLEEGYARFQNTVVEEPERIGRRLGGVQNELDEAASEGPLFLLLSKLEERVAGSDFEIIHDSSAFGDLFEVRSQPSRRSGVDHLEDAGAALENGTTLQFPSGVFRPQKLMNRGSPFPRDITLQGAGMDTTLLILSNLTNDAPVANLALRDCTIFTASAPFFDLRREPSTVFMENVRFIGFDSGAGGSSLFYSPAGAFLARNCRFEGGYGRRPGYAKLFDIRSPAHVARFEGCTLSLVNAPWHHLQGRLVFQGCTLEAICTWGPDREVPSSVTLSNTTLDYLDTSQTKVEAKDLNELFPDWEARLEE